MTVVSELLMERERVAAVQVPWTPRAWGSRRDRDRARLSPSRSVERVQHPKHRAPGVDTDSPLSRDLSV